MLKLGMKKLLIFAVLVLSIIFLVYSNKAKVNQNSVSKTAESVKDADISESLKEEYMFVPYWTIDTDLISAPSDNLIYFGIAADNTGIDTNEVGYKNLSSFVKNSSNKDTYLTVRMLDSDANLDILEDKVLQRNIISQSIDIAKENGFKGIVLDFEIQGIPFESFVKSITSLNENFAANARRSDLTFGTLIYGDAYFRARPYDVAKISDVADRVYVMAYDFSKARGNPGPNFPLDGKETYGYDFKEMVKDYLRDVPKSKLTIVFGMFGYDWKVDDEGRGSETAVSNSTLGFEKFMTACISFNTCTLKVDEITKESRITYEKDSKRHVVWFENDSSMQKKVEYLNSVGVNSIGFWAYSFF